jgi:hypothetical protein
VRFVYQLWHTERLDEYSSLKEKGAFVFGAQDSLPELYTIRIRLR